MAISDVAICNLALDAAMARSSISSIGENSAEGQACARHYEQAKQAMLRAVHWNFARKQITLALLNDATTSPPGPVPQPWMYEYAYPSDCLLAYGVLPQMLNPNGSAIDAGWQPPQPQMPVSRFIVAQDNDITSNAIPVILTNVPQAQLVYTVRVTNPNLFDPMFVDAFTLYLASRIARPITGDKQHAVTLFQQAEALVRQASGMNGNEGPTVIDSVPDWIRVRGYLPDWQPVPGAGWLDPMPLTMVV